MAEIRINGEALDLQSEFSMEIEDTNPVFNERGSQSVPATIPATRRNCRILDFPNRIDSVVHPNNPERVAYVVDGAYIRRGKMNISEVSLDEGLTFNIGFDNSTAYAEWLDKKIVDLPRLATYYPSNKIQGNSVSRLLKDLYDLYTNSNPQIDPLAVFPIAVDNPEPSSSGSEQDKVVCWEILNRMFYSNGLNQPSTVSRCIDGVVTSVTVPQGYGVTAFVRAWRLLEIVFDNFGMTIDENPFKDSIELARLVVLNNCADACCLGKIKYSDILPDCTVGEFLNSLWVRFGLVYSINYDKCRVRLRLIRDIINDDPQIDLLPFLSNNETITYNTPEYVKLSAKTSIDGAAPVCERFEDFIKGLDISTIKLGNDVSTWVLEQNRKWDGEDRYGFSDREEDYDFDYEDDDRDPQEPDDPYDDRDYDYDLMSVNSDISTMSTTDDNSSDIDEGLPLDANGTVAREYVSGNWFRLDEINGKVSESGSGFFQWDPQPKNYNAFELSSDDECVPVDKLKNYTRRPSEIHIDYCPMYLFGSRHYHSYIKSGSEASETGSTPLAYMIAYTRNNMTVGRLNSEENTGNSITLDDGSTPKLSLFFQFKDGLFAQFWRKFDELLRFGNRTVAVTTVMPKLELNNLEIINPIAFKGLRYMVETSTYSIPAQSGVNVEFKLRPLSTQGFYDLEKEQNIPGFSLAQKKLVWTLLSDTFDSCGTSSENIMKAVNDFVSSSGYKSHGSYGEFYTVDARSVEFTSITRYGITWETDPNLPEAKQRGQHNGPRIYKALAECVIFEIVDNSTGDDDRDNWRRLDQPLAGFNILIDYSVDLVVRWVDA